MGKEEILVEMAKFFKTKVVINSTRFKNLHDIGFAAEYFTLDPAEGWIFCIKGQDQEKYPG